ncbi:hypothetical protein Bca101_017128 [Brassica carinata]
MARRSSSRWWLQSALGFGGDRFSPSQISSGSSVCEEERRCVFPGLRRSAVPGQEVIWLGGWLSLARTSVAGSLWFCQRFKERSSMLLEWPSDWPPHLRSSSSRLLLRCIVVLIFSFLPWQATVLASPKFQFIGWARCGRYGGSNLFSSERHRVQAVPGHNKCLVLVAMEV